MRLRHGNVARISGPTAAVLLVGLLVPPARAQQLPAQPRDYVVDLAAVIDRSTAARLNGYLQELERKTAAQMIVLTVNTTGGIPIRDYGLQVAEKWKLGNKDRDNGVLIIVAIQDRKWTFEVGSGLEHVLPDIVCGRVGREVFQPAFRKGQYSQGLYQGTLVLANGVAADAGVQISGMPARQLRPARGGRGRWLRALIPLVILFFVFGSLSRRRRFGRSGGYYGGGGILPWLIIFGGLGGGRRYGGGWGGGFGGGFGGGGFGGTFGGGGGGSFGGGGASGGW